MTNNQDLPSSDPVFNQRHTLMISMIKTQYLRYRGVNIFEAKNKKIAQHTDNGTEPLRVLIHSGHFYQITNHVA